MKKIHLLVGTFCISVASFGQILYPAFKDLPAQPGVKSPATWGAVGDNLFVASEKASATAGYTDFSAQYYDGTAWSGFPNTTYKGKCGRIFLFNSHYYLTGNFKEANGLAPPSGRFFQMLQLKGTKWDTLANSDLPDSLANANIQCINTGFYLLHTISTAAGTLHKFIPGTGLVKTYNILLDPAYKNHKEFTMEGKANTLFVYGNIIKLDGNTLSRYFFTLYKDTVKTPALSGSGVPIRAAIDFNDDIYVLSEYGGGPFRYSKGSNTNIRYNQQLTMLGYIMAGNGEVFMGPGRQVSGKYTYDWYLPNTGTTWYLPYMNDGGYGIVVSKKYGFFCLDVSHGIWRYLGTNPGGVVRGKYYADLNKNCLFDAGKDSLLRKAAVTLKSKNGIYSAITDDNGDYSIILPLDSFSFQFNQQDFVLNSCSKKYIKTDTNRTDTVDVAVYPKYTNNLLAHFTNGSVARRDANYGYSILVKNNGTIKRNAHLTVYYDPRQVLVSATGASATSTAKIEWNIINLAPVSQRKIDFVLNLPFDSFTLGDKLCLMANLDTANGEDILPDNKDTLCQKVVYSYDPNGKESNHDGTANLGLKKLTYYIHFQNEGNDYAENVVIRDTLANTLMPEGFVFLGSSHPCKVSLNGRILTASFSNIMLQAKSVNEPASKGWISFELPVAGGLVVGDKIQNKAGIYFDRNPAIITNTATTVLTSTAVVKSVTVKNEGLLVYPVPAGNQVFVRSKATPGTPVLLYSLDGKLLLSAALGSNGITELDLRSLGAGIYLVHCGHETVKLLK